MLDSIISDCVRCTRPHCINVEEHHDTFRQNDALLVVTDICLLN